MSMPGPRVPSHRLRQIMRAAKSATSKYSLSGHTKTGKLKPRPITLAKLGSERS